MNSFSFGLLSIPSPEMVNFDRLINRKSLVLLMNFVLNFNISRRETPFKNSRLTCFVSIASSTSL